MLAKPIFLWPGGPSLTLGSYLIGFKVIFAMLFIAWAVGLARRPSRACLLGGTIGLACFAWLVLHHPLERPYGMDAGLPGLFELAQPMVAASRAGSAEGWLVGQENPRLLWSLLLAVASGFDPNRLLSFYPWIPLGGLVFFALALDWGLGAVAPDDRPEAGMARGLGVFFVIFLGSEELSVQLPGGPLWPRLFFLEPRVAFALGALAAHLRLLASSHRCVEAVLAGASLALVLWLDARLGAYTVLGGLIWLGMVRERGRPRFWPALALSLGAAAGVLGWWRVGTVFAEVSQQVGSWDFAARQVLSLSRHGGLVFLLGVLGLVRMGRGPNRGERLVAALFASGMLLWCTASFSSRAAALVDLRLVDTFLGVFLAAAAGLEAHRLLILLEQKLRAADVPSLPAWLSRPGLGLVTGLALPWSFPYWWHPVRFDSTYVRSLTPISHQVLTLAEWIRAEVPRDAVFVAGQSYAAWIPALTGRQVLRIEAWPPSRDARSRKEAETWFVESRDAARIRAVAEEWRLTHVAWGRLDAASEIDVDYAFFESSPLFRKVWQQGRWVRVFALRPP